MSSDTPKYRVKSLKIEQEKDFDYPSKLEEEMIRLRRASGRNIKEKEIIKFLIREISGLIEIKDNGEMTVKTENTKK